MGDLLGSFELEFRLRNIFGIHPCGGVDMRKVPYVCLCIVFYQPCFFFLTAFCTYILL